MILQAHIIEKSLDTSISPPALHSRTLRSVCMSSQNDTLRTTAEVTLQILLLSQLMVGTMANVVLFFHNVSPIIASPRQKPTQVVLTHMAVANSLVLLSTGLPHIMMAFVPRNPLSSLGCKIVYYSRLVARSTTLCSTCVLSTYQFLTLIPMKLGRVMLRRRVLKAIGSSCCTCWMFSILNNIHIPMKVTGPQDMHNGSDYESKWVCSTTGFNVGMVLWRFAQDTMFIGFMVWTSGSMVIVLHRHHQRLQHIHTHNLYHKGVPETRAAHTILMLVISFVSFYILNSIYAAYYIAFVSDYLWWSYVSDILVASFPTASPLLLILRDPKSPSFRS